MTPPDTRIRLAVVLPSLDGGGAERVIVRLLGEIDPGQFEVVLVVGRLEGAFASDLPSSVAVVEVGRRRTRTALVPLWQALRRVQPDVILSTLGLNLAVLMVRPLLRRRPGVVARLASTVGAEDRRRYGGVRRLAFRWAQRRLYGRADAVVCQSESMAQDARSYLSIAADRIATIHNPIDGARLAAAASGPDPFVREPGVQHLLAVGRLHSSKGFDLLLPALATVLRTHPRARLTILGDGPERAALERQRDTLGLREAVDLRGFVDNPYVWMRHANLLVLSSRYEGFANVLIEALSLGTPAVAFDAPGGMREVVREGENGWLAEAEDVGSLVAAIQRGLDGRARLDMKAEAAEVRRRFDIGQISQSYERILRDAVPPQAAPRSDAAGGTTPLAIREAPRTRRSPRAVSTEPAPLPARDDVVAVCVTYYPDPELEANLATVLPHVRRVVVVDNTPSERPPLPVGDAARQPGVQVVRLGENRGLGGALNVGLAEAASDGAAYLLTMDQDSRLHDDWLDGVRKGFAAGRPQVAAVGVGYVHADGHTPSEPAKKHGVEAHDRVITSGTLWDVAAATAVGGFGEGLMVDGVDHDMCFRLRRAGRTVWVSWSVAMTHRLGGAAEVRYGGRAWEVSAYPPVRYYYAFRNTIEMARRYGRDEPSWLRDQSKWLYYLLKSAVLMRSGPRLRAIARGVADGAARRLGPAPPALLRPRRPSP